MTSFTSQLHELFNQIRRFTFPYDDREMEMPKNGICIFFEKGEKFGQIDRIVFVGTHTSNNKLQSRLKEHFITHNKDRSIFRKNIGRCILAKEKHPYLSVWNRDFTAKATKELYGKEINFKLQQQIEETVSQYIQNNISFCVIQIEDPKDRLFWKSKIISTLAQSGESHPSNSWLGNHSPKEKIRKFGLWQEKQLTEPILSLEEFENLRVII
jgi:hypothetical protein